MSAETQVPSSGPRLVEVSPQLAEPAQRAAPRRSPEPARQPAGKGKKKSFRETAWFKRGELEEEMAREAAELTAEDPLAGPAVLEADVDPATLTAEDRARLSLKTGRTEMMQAVTPSMVPGDKMSDAEIMAELDSSRKYLVIAGAVIFAAAVAAAVYYLLIAG